MSGKIIYLTGAPATGKSTLGKNIEQCRDDVELISYSAELVNYINNKDVSNNLDEVMIRKKSAHVVTESDINVIDQNIINRCRAEKIYKNIIIDSHPVTKEDYGFRITGFKDDVLKKLSPDVVICLYADPQVISERIRSNPGGRPLPSIFEIEVHIQTQINLAAVYGILAGCPVYLIDSNEDPTTLAKVVIGRCKLNA